MPTKPQDREFLGTGLAFPLQVNPRGEIALVSGERDIAQAIRVILETIPGERVMRPEFGCRLNELVFAPNNSRTAGLAERYVREALGRWEPRIRVTSVTVEIDSQNEGRLEIMVTYEIKAIHSSRSLVYPFYLIPEE